MEKLKAENGKEHDELTKLKLELAAKDNELSKLRARVHHAAPPAVGRESRAIVASLEHKAAGLTSTAMAEADDAAALSAKVHCLCWPPLPTFGSILRSVSSCCC